MSGINNRLLTIIIPTYNRKEEVRMNLEHTIPLVQEFADKVSIYVSDNASTDGTGEMVQEYVAKYPDIVSYYCQPENITASPNFDHAVHAVESEYCFILGDDDFIFPSFIPTVLDMVNKYPNVGWFHLNSVKGYENGRKSALYKNEIIKPFVKVYSRGGDLLYDHLHTPSFVSSNIFKQSLWLKGSSYIKEDCSGYVWMSILAYGSLNYESVYVSAPLLLAGIPAKTSYSKWWLLYYTAGLGQLFKYLDEEKTGIYKRWIDYQQKENFRKFLIDITDVARNKEFYKSKYSEIAVHIHNNCIRGYLYLCVFVFPSKLSIYLFRNMLRGLRILEIL